MNSRRIWAGLYFDGRTPVSVRSDRETAVLVCGRFTSSQRREVVGERFEVAVPESYAHRFNLAPAQRALIIRVRNDEREAVMAKWGLLPHWAKDSKIAFKMINARAETLTEKPAYRGLLSRYRCLIPADGFYEWTVGSDGKKHPIHCPRSRQTPRICSLKFPRVDVCRPAS
jgi:putative SOS response-associated peptidase YedK